MEFLSEFNQQIASAVAPVHLGKVAASVLVAIGIGVVVAGRPWRLLLRGAELPKAKMVQSQLLLCAAAALLMMVIGDSLAKAFSLVGLGGFVRFKSPLKDPRDAASTFVLLGLGMACGHGNLGMACVGAGIVALLLLAMDLIGPVAQETGTPDLPLLTGLKGAA
jgi:hypothetical protein